MATNWQHTSKGVVCLCVRRKFICRREYFHVDCLNIMWQLLNARFMPHWTERLNLRNSCKWGMSYCVETFYVYQNYTRKTKCCLAHKLHHDISIGCHDRILLKQVSPQAENRKRSTVRGITYPSAIHSGGRGGKPIQYQWGTPRPVLMGGGEGYPIQARLRGGLPPSSLNRGTPSSPNGIPYRKGCGTPLESMGYQHQKGFGYPPSRRMGVPPLERMWVPLIYDWNLAGVPPVNRQTDWQMLVKLLPFPILRTRAVIIGLDWGKLSGKFSK